MAPTAMKQWIVTSDKKEFDGLEYVDADVPKVGDYEVLVKLEGASLNYRDLIIPKGKYPFATNFPVVAGSDGAGTVQSTGSSVTRFKPGDKVVTLFNQAHQNGPMTPEAYQTGLGGAIDGTLRQYAVFPETGVSLAPSNLNSLETATLTCAGLTSWNALYPTLGKGAPLQPGQTVLVQGTGGVSLFALQFAKAAGARVIATSSSKEKLEKLKKLGADHVINYKEDTNWGETAKKLTHRGEGVDFVIEVGGANTMSQSLKAVKYEGVIAVIGLLTGVKAEEQVPAMAALAEICTFRGVYVGSRAQLEDMIAAVEACDIHPVVDDKVFAFKDLKQAYEYMWAQKHFGKVTVKIE